MTLLQGEQDRVFHNWLWLQKNGEARNQKDSVDQVAYKQVRYIYSTVVAYTVETTQNTFTHLCTA